MKTPAVRLRHIAVLALAALSIAAAPVTDDGTATEDTTTSETTTSETTTTDDTTEPDTTDETSGTSTTDADDSGTETEETNSSPDAETTDGSDTQTSDTQTSAESEPDASATAVEVEDVIVVSEATASEDSASATVLELGGERVVGGDADGGSNSGAILDTEDTELGRLALGPWSATTDGSGSSSEASAAEVTVIDEDTFYAHVLRSRAAADGNGGTSASSDAVVLAIGGEDEVRVLSSTWTADGPESALVRQGDETIGQDADGQCQLEVPSVLQLLCLTGTDGQGGTLVPGDNEDAEYASLTEAVLFEEQGLATVRAGGETAPAATTDPATEQDTAESPSPGTDDGDLAAAPDTDAPETGESSLPVTGGGVTVLAIGLLLLAAGLVLRRRAALTA